MRRTGKRGGPRAEKNARPPPPGAERRLGAVPLSCFPHTGPYRGPNGGRCPSRSRTHFPRAAQRAALSGTPPLSSCLTRVLFPFIADIIHAILPEDTRHVKRSGQKRRAQTRRYDTLDSPGSFVPAYGMLYDLPQFPAYHRHHVDILPWFRSGLIRQEPVQPTHFHKVCAGRGFLLIPLPGAHDASGLW